MRKSLYIVLALGVVGALAYALWDLMPRRIPANVVFQDPGHYVSPQGLQTLEFDQEEDGTWNISVTHESQSSSGMVFGTGSSMTFSGAGERLLCWDSQDRLWTYIAAVDPNYCRCWYVAANGKGTGTRRPGEAGGWDGIPQAFLARLPKHVRSIHDQHAKQQAAASESAPEN